MTIYLDSDFRCHLQDDGTRMAVETEAFEGKCEAFVSAYHYIPSGYSWQHQSGIIYNGLAIIADADYSVLARIQEQYEYDQEQSVDMQNALEILGVNP